jgi:hypothetical protein
MSTRKNKCHITTTFEKDRKACVGYRRPSKPHIASLYSKKMCYYWRHQLVLLVVLSQTLAWSNNKVSPAVNFSDNIVPQEAPPIKVLVTGAAGKTGRLVLEQLLQDPRYEAKGLVRTEKSAHGLVKGDVHCPLENIIISDITSPTFQEDLPSCLNGTAALIICTSAVPRISQKSLLRAILQAPFNLVRRRKAFDFRQMRFKWKNGGYPEKVDYHGQLAQIDLAIKLGVTQVIVLSSMGGTEPNNFLNHVGKNKDGSGNGDILLWKRKAEMYLVQVRIGEHFVLKQNASSSIYFIVLFFPIILYCSLALTIPLFILED